MYPQLVQHLALGTHTAAQSHAPSSDTTLPSSI